MQKNSLIQQRGAAIIVALFVMALVAACAAAMMYRLNVDVQRTALILNADNATLYAQGSIDWAIEQLKLDIKNQRPNQVIDRLPITSPADSMDGFTITSTIADMQNKFNLNDLEDAKQQERFVHLVHFLLPKVSLLAVNELSKSILDWTSPKGTDSKLAAFYEKQPYPYLSPHKPMVSVSELRLVKGVTPQIYQTLLPFVSALPQGTKLNVNTTSWVILYSMTSLMSPQTAKLIQNHCLQMPFASVADFLNFDIVKNNPLPGDLIDVNSSYFLVKTSVKVAEQQIMIYTMLHRSLQDKAANVNIVWQSKGTL